ncbi:MAG: phosphoribosylaminoimidazolesuccinocarboxamide synthase [Chitinophagales bacterium]|nr:phosphoribosylaminoimidazolesuccinocarboxamide synthase [Bacteroidota bacterium]
MSQGLYKTNFHFENQTDFYRGKVRDVYYFKDKIALIATDRISAFDCILPRPIPYKGQVLNQLAWHFLENTRHQVPNWSISMPNANTTIGYRCEPFKVEIVVRAYLAGHAWRLYKAGRREICGQNLPEGLREADPLPQLIITPTTKAAQGHDQDISPSEIIKQGLLTDKQYQQIEAYAFQLFSMGAKMANDKNLILVDTKFEFGQFENKIMLMDEIFTPDSSRYYYADTYVQNQEKGIRQKQLSKEFVREWLMQNNFQGLEGQQMPAMPNYFVNEVTEKYVELYQILTGKKFYKADNEDFINSIKKYL